MVGSDDGEWIAWDLTASDIPSSVVLHLICDDARCFYECNNYFEENVDLISDEEIVPLEGQRPFKWWVDFTRTSLTNLT